MKVDFGIHISDTSVSIARMIDGQPTIIKTNLQKDKTPLCVGFNKKGCLIVGDKVYNQLKLDKLRALKTGQSQGSNFFSEFVRTIGSDKKHYSSHTNQEYSSEQLLGFVIRTTRSFVKDNDLRASVIAVPNDFRSNQIEATRKAGVLGGLEQVEIVKESIAASVAYGLGSNKKEGVWLVFDFGTGTFDATLIGLEKGTMKVIDNKRDNYLGGNNLDYAIVDEIILPYTQENFVIDSFLENNTKKQILRNTMKYYAEEAKIALSSSETYVVCSSFGELPSDDKGNEIELDIEITKADVSRVLTTLFQRALDISLSLLDRNNLRGSSLNSLILVGGSTYSPVLRKMLEEQIHTPDYSADPTTAVSKGSSLYASKIEIHEGVRLNNLSIIEVENFLFELLENEKIERSDFQTHYDIIFDMKKEDCSDLETLKKIYKELKALPNNV